MSAPQRPIIAWPTWSIGTLIAVVVLLAVLVAAFVGDVKVVNFDWWLIGGLSVAILLR